jgi:ubiquinone/menaquinone biosynthesis C-methylase UbiE
MTAASPYPELKAVHTMAKTGRPWTDRKPPPAGPVWAVIQGHASYWSLVAALDLGVFDALRDLGASGAEAVAEHIGASPAHLLPLLDGLVVLGLLDQCQDRFTLNDTALRYLVSDSVATMAGLVAVAPGPRANWERLAETIRRGGPAEPIEEDPAAFYVPLVRATFPTQLRLATRADLAIGYSRLQQPRLLELGAGGAPWTVAVLTACSRATAVVNDLPTVIDVAAEKVADHHLATRVELRPGDFHTVPVEDAAYDLVVLGHVCRAEGAVRAPTLIDRCFAALSPGGRLVVSDYFASNDRKRNPFGVLMGLTMIASTTSGNTLTHAQVHGWLRATGFEAIRLVEPIGSNQLFVASRPTEAR